MSKQSNTDAGKPAGSQPAQGTGIPQRINDGNMEKDEELTQKYTDDEQEVKDFVRTGHPNRNVGKGEND